MSFKCEDDMSDRELIAFYNSKLQYLYAELEGIESDEYYLNSEIERFEENIDNIYEKFYGLYLYSLEDCDDDDDGDYESADFRVGRYLNETVQSQLLSKVDERQLQQAKRDSFNHIHEELIAAAMSPKRLLAQMGSFDDIESFFDNL